MSVPALHVESRKSKGTKANPTSVTRKFKSYDFSAATMYGSRNVSLLITKPSPSPQKQAVNFM